MRKLSTSCFVVGAISALLGTSAVANADVVTDLVTDPGDPKDGQSDTPAPSVEKSAPVQHAAPRLKLSYRNFNISNLNGTPVALNGGQLDVYPLSRRYLRLGIEAEAGAGDATLNSSTANLWYAMAGVTAGFQYPWRVTPFVEGRFAAGALGGSYSGSLGQVSGASVSVTNASAATVMYVGGVDVGMEVYTVSRLYVSASIGWAHPVYTGFDYAAMEANPTAGMKLKQISDDTFTFKIGLGI